MFDNTVVHTPPLHVTLTIISLIATIIGTAVSFMILTCTLLRKETFTNVRLMLCTNNYIAIFFVGIVEIVHLIIVTQSDFGIAVINIEILGCRIRVYILFSCLSVVYLACVLQVS